MLTVCRDVCEVFCDFLVAGVKLLRGLSSFFSLKVELPVERLFLWWIRLSFRMRPTTQTHTNVARVWRRKEVGSVSLGRNAPHVTPSHVEWASGSSALWECWTHKLHKSTFKQQIWRRHTSRQLPLSNTGPLWPHLAALWGGDQRKVANKLIHCMLFLMKAELWQKECG